MATLSLFLAEHLFEIIRICYFVHLAEEHRLVHEKHIKSTHARIL